VGERIGVTDEEWAIIGPLLPLERGRWSRPAQDNRRYFEGMLWIARSGSQWRHLPDEYGKWNSVFRRFRRWVEIGVFDALIETLVELVKRDRSADMVDTTIIRAHHCAAGKKGGLQDQEALGRSRGGFSTKIHARCDGKGRPLGFTITPGQAHDIKGFTTLLRMIGDKIDALLADKGYDADVVRQALSEMEVEAIIPSKSNHKQPIAFDREAYKRRNLIERMFNKLKNWRRVATRYDKTASSFLAFIMMASAKLWMPFVHGT
jgi:transposase